MWQHKLSSQNPASKQAKTRPEKKTMHLLTRLFVRPNRRGRFLSTFGRNYVGMRALVSVDIEQDKTPNVTKMTTPAHFFLQRKCDTFSRKEKLENAE